jgi:hypothetical protein
MVLLHDGILNIYIYIYIYLHNGGILLKNLKKSVSFFNITKHGSHSSHHNIASNHNTFYFWVTTIHIEYQTTLLVSAYEQLEELHMALSPLLSSFVCVCVCVCVEGRRGVTAIQKMHFSFVGLFKILQKMTASSCLPKCLFIHLHVTTQLPMDRFSWNIIFQCFF